jgi:hypothetical protein
MMDPREELLPRERGKEAGKKEEERLERKRNMAMKMRFL